MVSGFSGPFLTFWAQPRALSSPLSTGSSLTTDDCTNFSDGRRRVKTTSLIQALFNTAFDRKNLGLGFEPSAFGPELSGLSFPSLC